MPDRPLIRSFAQLTADDFERHPVWASVHSFDHDEPWYDDCDEEDFRPHEGDVPVSASDGMYLVAASAVLADGTVLPGFLTPAADADPGTMQPYVFVGGSMVGFWGGFFGFTDEEMASRLLTLGRTAEQVFPLQLTAHPGLALSQTEITMDDFLDGQPKPAPTSSRPLLPLPESHALVKSPALNPVQSLMSVFSHYASFSGRARRSEFWWFMLLVTVLYLAAILTVGDDWAEQPIALGGLLLLLLPYLAVSVRRLHDTGRSGWLMLISLVPIASFALLFWWSQDSEGDNQYGAYPKWASPST
jgi:uncharacterized membrane protein YhaH (DUF805 family)